MLVPDIPPSHPDWIATVVFYAALHAIDALLAHDGVTVERHTDRNRLLQITVDTRRLQSSICRYTASA